MILSILTLFCVFIICLLLISYVFFRLPKPIPAPSIISGKAGLKAIFQKPSTAAPQRSNPRKKGDRGKFIQTLSATFAQLMVGIAVFDNDNKLSLFNPALSKHLGLRPEWLLKQPNLLSFMDRLRNTQILPEPKDYASWCQTFRQIERSAMQDDFREDWDLPDGRTLRVIGRPHPSGTVVFLFEDVTNTLAMERQFRSKIHPTFPK